MPIVSQTAHVGLFAIFYCVEGLQNELCLFKQLYIVWISVIELNLYFQELHQHVLLPSPLPYCTCALHAYCFSSLEWCALTLWWLYLDLKCYHFLMWSSIHYHMKTSPPLLYPYPPNKHFNLTITAYNGYGNTSTTVVISKSILEKTLLYTWSCATHPFLVGTFDVVGVSVNTSSPMGLVCLFNTGSLARGCLVYLTDTDTGVTYCRVVWRSLDIPVDMSLCPSCNGPLSTGVYLSRGVWHWERWECIISTSTSWRDCDSVWTIYCIWTFSGEWTSCYFMWAINPLWTLCYARTISHIWITFYFL